MRCIAIAKRRVTGFLSSQPPSSVGIAKESVDACVGAENALDDHASDSSFRDLIWRMAAENCLWGAPRIYGELLKLGIDISERTVSRYLRSSPRARSQTWRTFFANHFGDTTLASPDTVTVTNAPGEDVADASGLAFHLTLLSINGSCVSARSAADCSRSL